jgi:uncharacterized protein (DUF433 family)
VSEAVRPEDAILSDPKVLGGRPCFAGTRVPVESLFDLLRLGYTIDYFVHQFPTVSREQAIAVLELAKQMIPEQAEKVP